ncbi:quinol dehydrogenase periplasmic component [compost metagenome]
MEPESSLSREAFVREGMGQLGQHFGLLFGAWLGLSPQRPVASPRPLVLRPPGALPEEAFSTACTRCDACAAACPAFAIKVAGRLDPVAEGTPFMHDPLRSPCLLCEDAPCIAACEPGALVPGPLRLGRAEIAEDRCLAFAGTACTACAEACPLGEEAIVVREGRPLVVPLGCVGCGQCLGACPAPGGAIAVRPLP